MTTADYYAESRVLLERCVEIWAACEHEQRDYETEYKQIQYRYCRACLERARPIQQAYYAARKADRKRELADTPRCCIDGCKRRATWNFPYDVSVCGQHKRKMLAGHARVCNGLGGLALCVATYDRESMLRWAVTP